MNSERHSRIKDIFHAACEQPVDQREHFLDRACGEDKSLRDELAALLAHDDNPVTIMRPSAGGSRLPSGHPPAAG